MTISKKLFLIATIGLGLGIFNASAYDVVGLKEEVTLISTFAKNHDYPVEYNGQRINIRYWLEDKIYHTYMTSDYTIAEIANTIKQNNAFENLLIMKEQELKKYEDILGGILFGTFATGAIVLSAKAIEGFVWHKNNHQFLNAMTMDLLSLTNKQQEQIDAITQKLAA